jgi:hypothetical protein
MKASEVAEDDMLNKVGRSETSEDDETKDKSTEKDEVDEDKLSQETSPGDDREGAFELLF